MPITTTKILLGAKKLAPILPYLAVIGIVSGAGLYIYNKGLHNAYERAARTHETVINELHEQFNADMEQRDKEWDTEVSKLLQQVTEFEEQRRLDLERERELQTRIRSLSTSLQEIQRDVYESDIGTCSLTAEFDRVLLRARDAAYTP